MKSANLKTTKMHIVKLEKGDDIITNLLNYCKSNEMISGIVSGIGAVSTAHIGFYDIVTKSYLTRKLTFDTEIVSCTGNITKIKESNEYVLHLHIVLSDKNYVSYGGHVMEGTVISVTGEFFIIETDQAIFRSRDKETTLNLITL